MGLLFSRRRVPSCRKHASHTGERRLRRPCVRCLAPLGQGALPVCVFDAVCPAGQKRFRVGAPDFGRSTGKSFLRGVLPIRKLSRRAGERETEPSYIFQRGGDVCRLTGGTRPSPGKIFHIILPPQTRHSTRRASSPTIPRGERRALPAPAQGIHPLRIPFWGTAAVSPRLPSPNHRLLPPSPRPNRTAAHPPPARGAGVRRIRANGTGRRHCRLLIFGAFCCKMK